ncbi:serine hydrolase [Elizabethkingia argentiflava]|uniref:Serine hydrolase n=1 Tax=Elizabethkingia argenteiflava TaxID=2681556 RepID=A0A845PV40_9FLAO|nr:serine hydrolase [Elizabethkingia argenteiflava]NAW50347.1 serine hydrolase [Elizabethkingia argenteiflava]
MWNILLYGVFFLLIAYWVWKYRYLITAVRKTYMKGKWGAHILDGQYSAVHIIKNAEPQPWEKDNNYNQTPLSYQLLEHLAQTKTVSFLVVKRGKLLAEYYWSGHDEKSKTNSFSMAKSLTVMLLGCAIHDNKIQGTEAKLIDFYPEFSQDPYGKLCSLEHLSAMESGLDWEEDYSSPFKPNAKAYYGDDLAELMLKRRFKSSPGRQFEYQSGTTQLLGFAIRKAIGMSLSDYASEKLWKPLGMEESAFWNLDRTEGMEKTYCCINAISRDFAKLGQLLLNLGQWQGKQILQPEFVKKMITGTPLSQGAYGNGIWVNKDAAVSHYYLRGLYGQYVICIPEHDIVMVRTGYTRSEQKDSKGRPAEVAFIVDEIVQLFNA